MSNINLVCCTATEDGSRLEIWDLERRGINPYMYVVETKALICCAVTTQLFCAFFLHIQEAGFLMTGLICSVVSALMMTIISFSAVAE